MGSERDKKLDEIRKFEHLLEKQTGKAVRPYRADSYVNLLNRYGTSKDTTEHYRFQQEPPVPDDMLTAYYEGNGLFAKIIDTPAEEAIKHGFEMTVKDQEIQDFYKGALDELDWEETAMTAIKWARLFGGSIVVMLINDGRGLDEPVDWKNIRSIDDLRVYDRSVVQEDTSSMFAYRPDDPFRTRSSRLGMPEYYDVFSRYGHFRVHDSRCLVFQNGLLPENTTNSIYQMWGIPEYIRINRAIRDAEVAHGSAIKLLDRSIQAVYKMKDLAAELATEEGEDRVLRRLQTIDMARGLLNSITIDADGEDYDFRTFQFTGVSDVVDSACNYLSALTSIPQTILFGRSPAGMNSTGESDLENWYNYLERIQSRMVKKNLRYLLSIIFQAGVACGEVDEVPDISIEFNPLWSMSESEKAAIDQQKAQTQQVRAQTAQIYMDAQVIDPSEVRRKLADSDEFDIENMLDEIDEEDLFANMPQGGDDDDLLMGGGMPGDPSQAGPAPQENPPAENATEAQGKIPEEGDFTDYAEGVDVEEHNTDPGTEGSAPTAAPAATKLPEDMSEEEKEKAEEKKDSRSDEGNSNSGNHGHEGRPGEIGGSAPSSSGLNDKVSSAYKSGDYSNVVKSIRSALKDMPSGSTVTSKGVTYRKVDDNNYDSRNTVSNSPKATKTDANDVNNNLSTNRPKHGSVGVLVIKDGCILSGTRLTGFNSGLVCGPGGHVEDGETHEQAAIRETQEEFGITPKGLIQIGLGPWEPDTGLKPAVFLATEYEGTLRNTDGEMGDLRFRSLAELREMDKAMFQPFADAIELMLQIIGPDHFDGGPGSGNWGHEGRIGEIGGSAPKDSASCTKTVEIVSKTKTFLNDMSDSDKCAYLSNTGVIPKSEIKQLQKSVDNGDETALEKLNEYQKSYQYMLEHGAEAKSLEVEMRNTVQNMETPELREWLENSTNRSLKPSEQWANDDPVQKAVIDMGMNETPQVVCKEDFDSYVNENGTPVIYRGVVGTDTMSAKNIYFQTMYSENEPYMGNGVSGSGLYFSTKENTATSYAGTGDDGKIMTCTIRSDAKVLDGNSDEAYPVMEKFDKTGLEYNSSLAVLCSGYDAFKIGQYGEDYYVILNRAALIALDDTENAIGVSGNISKDSRYDDIKIKADLMPYLFNLFAYPTGYFKEHTADKLNISEEDRHDLIEMQAEAEEKKRSRNKHADGRSDSLMSASDLATAFNSAISKNRDKEQKYLDRYLKSDIIKVRTQSTSAEAFQALAPEDIAFIAEEFGVDVSSATEGELQAVMAMLRMDGGPGSGNHGHKGVKDQRGGSAPKGSESSSGSGEKKAKTAETTVKKFGGASTKNFVKSLSEAKATVPEESRWRVDTYTEETMDREHPGANLHVTDGGSTVAVTSDGDIISVCHKEGDTQRGRDLLEAAVANGGTKLDAFGPVLYSFYTRNKFEPVSWTPFNKEYAPEGWDASRDSEEPVIFYKYTGKVTSQSYSDFISSTAPCEGDDGYEKAGKLRDESMEG